MNKHVFFFIILLGMFACGKKDIQTKSYYFPYASFTEQKVYKYTDTSDSSKILYWHFNTEVKDGDTLFSTGIYNHQFALSTVFINLVTDDGIDLKEMYVNVGDSNKLYKCLIKSGEVFQWKVKEKIPLFLSYSISTQDKSESEEVVTDRSFERKKQTAIFQGYEYECLVIKEKTLINHIKVNRTQTDEQERTSFFAEGIGLIRFETYNADATSSVFALDKILTLQEWEQMLTSKADSLSETVSK